MRRSLRTIAGFLIAPLVVPVVMASVVFLFVKGDLSGALFAAAVSAAFAFTGMGVIGLPAYLLLPKRGPQSFFTAALVGLLAGIITIFMSVALYEHDGGSFWNTLQFVVSLRSNWIGAIVPAGFGILVGMVFWLIARPDRMSR